MTRPGLGQDHLTGVNEAAENSAAVTYPGQAHFADPASSHACAECEWFQPPAKGAPVRGRCVKAANLSMRSVYSLPAFPASACACRYFSATTTE
jgi:hypothetical protein